MILCHLCRIQQQKTAFFCNNFENKKCCGLNLSFFIRYETLIESDPQTRVIGLAISFNGRFEDEFVNLLSQYFQKAVVDMHSDYFIPRVVRLFNSSILPDTSQLQRAGCADSVGAIKNIAWCYLGRQNEYLRCENSVLHDLKKKMFAQLWCDSIGMNGNIKLSGDHSVQ